MRIIPVLLFLIVNNLVFAQNNDYRFSIGGGFHSMMFWGLKDFENIQIGNANSLGPDNLNRIYQQETYTVNYHNFSSSKNLTFNFGINWFEKENWALSQRFYFFTGRFKDGMTQTLTDHSDEVYYFTNPNEEPNITIGNVTTMSYTTWLSGYGTSFIFLRKFYNGKLKLGPGIYLVYFNSFDSWDISLDDEFAADGYRPRFFNQTNQGYITNQLGLSISALLSRDIFSFYLTLGNNFITLKKEDKKGSLEWRDPDINLHFFPTSHNFDFRFPLTFEAGLTISLVKIKEKE